MRHLKLAARMLLKTPFVTAIAVASLALGIGANAAIFSLFNKILLQPLPVLDPNRLVNGADGARVRALVMRQLGPMLIAGGVVGVAAAFGLGRAAQSLLYGLQGHDPIVFTLSVAMLAGVAGLAGYIPARRAAHVDPMHALRYD